MTAPLPKQKSEAVPARTPPFSNCSYKECDLPGQCRREGKCHHPVSGSEEDRYVDEDGTVWVRPTAWAYAQVCKARDKWQKLAQASSSAREEGITPFDYPVTAAESDQRWRTFLEQKSATSSERPNFQQIPYQGELADIVKRVDVPCPGTPKASTMSDAECWDELVRIVQLSELPHEGLFTALSLDRIIWHGKTKEQLWQHIEISFARKNRKTSIWILEQLGLPEDMWAKDLRSAFNAAKK